MRVFTAAGMAAASLAIATSGCSSMKMPKLPTFGKKDKPAATTDGPQLTNAPPAPTNGTVAANAPPAGTQAQAPTPWSNLPMHPGTTYPVTPHPAPAIAQAQHTASPYGAPQAAPAYGMMPAQAAPATAAYTPYPSTPAPAANPYAPPAAQPQGGSYAAAVPTAQGPAVQTPAAPVYAQQAPPYTAPANPYTTPANPYAGPANPYAAPPAAQNASNPYAGSVTR